MVPLSLHEVDRRLDYRNHNRIPLRPLFHPACPFDLPHSGYGIPALICVHAPLVRPTVRHDHGTVEYCSFFG